MAQRLTDDRGIPFPVRFLATGFFSGYSPAIPGTAGSLVGLILYFIPGMEQSAILISASIVFLLTGVYVSRKMEEAFGIDPQIVVIDEIVGMWISLLFLPKSILNALCAFIFFRIYDTIKPPPARNLERLRFGWGIMMDDVAAGVYANLSTLILLKLFS